MNEIELEFLEEYKHLEKLLNDVFEVQHGVSEYIKILEEKEHLGSRIVSSWMNDYYSLKHVRYIRNKITHDSDASGCEEKDIDFVKDFYEKIMNHTDPLALLNKYNLEKQKELRQRQKEANLKTNENTNDENTHKGRFLGTFLLAILAIVLFVVLTAIIIEVFNSL